MCDQIKKHRVCIKIVCLKKFGKLWLAAEVLLFVLVGAAVDIRYTMDAGLAAGFDDFCCLAFFALSVY